MAPNFFDIPVKGEVTGPVYLEEQLALGILAPAVNRVFADPLFHDFGWTQHSSIHHADAGQFMTRDFWIRTVQDIGTRPSVPVELDILHSRNQITEEEYQRISSRYPPREKNIFPELFFLEDHPTLASDHPGYGAAEQLRDAIERGNFNAGLRSIFGDYADIRVTRACCYVTRKL